MNALSVNFKQALTAFLILLIAVFTLFGRTYNYNYSLLDDDIHIENNKNVRFLNALTLKKIWTQEYELFYTPVTYTVWASIGALSNNTAFKSPQSRFNPALFHLTNVLFHFLTSFVVFLCLQAISLSFIPSLLGAALYALHPVQVESVVWITGLRDVLAGFFGFLSLYFFIQGIQNPKKLKYSLWMLATFLLSILSKSSGLVIIAFQIIIGIFLLNKTLKEVLKYIAPLFIGSASYLPVFLQLNKRGLPEMPSLNPLEKAQVIVHNAGFYLNKLFLPLNNIFDYGLTPQKILSEKLYSSYALLILVLLFVIVLVDRYFKEKKFTACFLLFIVGFFPVSGIVPFVYQAISTVADRYLYFSVFALSLALAFFIQLKPKLNFALALFFLLFLGSTTLPLIKVWESNDAFYTHTLNKNPDSWISHNNAALAFEARKDYEGAYAHYRRAAELSNLARPWSNAGSIALKLEKFDLAEEAYRKALASAKDTTRARISLATALALKGNVTQAQAEVSNLKIDPQCENSDLIESKEAIENKDMKKLKTLRMDATSSR